MATNHRRNTAEGSFRCFQCLFVVAGLALASELVRPSAATEPSASDMRTAPARALVFEPNRGQADERVKFLARGAGYTAFLTSTEAVLTLGDGRPGRAIVRLRPVGADVAARIVGEGELPGVVNYVRGTASVPPMGVPTYRAVRYAAIYPGVDLVYYGSPDRLEYDFVVAPGGEPARIALGFDGVQRVEVDGAGTLVAHTAAGEIRQPRPVVYQDIDGARRRVDGDYVVDADGRVRIRLGAYDASLPLVIDPVLSFSTYLGGSGDEADWLYGDVVGIAVDPAGNAYVTGTTHSADFPMTGSDQTLNGDQDVFVTKFSPAGDVLYSTHLGGPCDDIGRDIAVDAAGNAYVTGRANAGFCPQGVEPGVLVAKLGPTGSLVYSLVFGGSVADSSIGEAIAVDANGRAYVTGPANSDTRDFPTTAGAFRTQACDDVWHSADGFVAKIDAAGTGLLYSTYICGTGNDSPSDIAIDADGNAYVAGSTNSPDFPTVNATQPTYHSASDGGTGFVAKLSPDGARLVYSTYFGGSESDAIGGIALDAQTNVYLTGETTSVDFPTTPGVLQEQPGYRLCVPSGPCSDAFVAKLDRSGSAIVYSTYLYGELDDAGSAIAVDGAGDAYVVGTTHSSYLPIRNAFQTDGGATYEAFIAKLNADGTRLVYGSYLGGSTSTSLLQGWDEGYAVAVDAAGNAYVAGSTQSNDFPTTPGAFQPGLGGGGCDAIGLACRDAFVARITAGGPGVVPPISLVATPVEVVSGGTLTATWAGIPAPTADDHLALFPLGSWAGAYDAVATWSTGAQAGASLLLALPTGLPSGTYELRLLTPDPDYFDQPTVIARSEPIRVAAVTTTSTTTTLPTTTTAPPTTTTSSSTSTSTTAHVTTSSTSSTTHAPTTTTLQPTSTTTSSTTSTSSTTGPSTTSTTRAPTTSTLEATSTTSRPASTSTSSSTAHPSTTSTSTTTQSPTSTTLRTPCEADPTTCDDGDPCTDDRCVPGQGCTSTPVSGFASVACTCRGTGPDACADQLLPAAIGHRRDRACKLFDEAADTRSPRRLRRGAATLKGAIAAVSKARKNGKISIECADVLAARLSDTKDRAEGLLTRFDSSGP